MRRFGEDDEPARAAPLVAACGCCSIHHVSSRLIRPLRPLCALRRAPGAKIRRKIGCITFGVRIRTAQAAPRAVAERQTAVRVEEVQLPLCRPRARAPGPTATARLPPTPRGEHRRAPRRRTAFPRPRRRRLRRGPHRVVADRRRIDGEDHVRLVRRAPRRRRRARGSAAARVGRGAVLEGARAHAEDHAAVRPAAGEPAGSGSSRPAKRTRPSGDARRRRGSSTASR